MAIVKLHPAFKDYIWGGTKLKELYNKKTDMDPQIGRASCRERV